MARRKKTVDLGAALSTKADQLANTGIVQKEAAASYIQAAGEAQKASDLAFKQTAAVTEALKILDEAGVTI